MEEPSNLLIAKKMGELDCEKLMHLYRGFYTNRGAQVVSQEAQSRRSLRDEEELWDFLFCDFFSGKGAGYYIRVGKNQYLSSLRLWHFQDGFLIEGLETDPDFRRQGHARYLLQTVQERIPRNTPLYAHVNRKNQASLKLHASCGFQSYLNYARGIFGDVSSKSVTLLWEKK